MQRAIQLAKRGQGWVEPNPLVGAVLVRGGCELTEGYHKKFGGPHAEVEALRNAKKRGMDLAGCEMAVSLEPCCHRGKTPPCTEALIKSRIGRVLVAMVDPSNRVAGQGIKALHAAGIDVVVGVCQKEACELNAPYVKRINSGLPWIIAKWAQTIDGRIATATGDSRWISSEGSRRRVHQLRSRVDAVMVGIQTVRTDDPQLTARNVTIRRQARRVVIDPNLRIPSNAAMLAGHDRDIQPPITLAVRKAFLVDRPGKLVDLEKRGVEFVGLSNVGSDSKALNLEPLFRHLVLQHGATNVLVEGGATLMGHLIDQRLIDQVLVFVSPKVAGDPLAKGAVAGLKFDRIADARQLTLRSTKRIDGDVLLEYRPE